MEFMTHDVREFALNLMEALDSSRSLTVAILVRHEDWLQLVSLKCDPHQYLTADQYYRDACATAIFKKKEERIPGVDPKQATLETWLACERTCFRSNTRLNEYLDFGTLQGEPAPSAVDEFFARARKAFTQLLGPRPPISIDGRFGPGATISDPGDKTTVAHKMSSIPSLTSSAFAYLLPWVGTKWATASAARNELPTFTRGNQMFMVPKTALVLRPCAKEPSVNSFYQLGLGQVMKRRLRAAGLDLQNGKKIHMEKAREGSITGDFVTLDLSSASDTVAVSLVRALASTPWFATLNDLRAAFTRVNGVWHRLEKFSSMGNGFTFELETTIFCSLAMAAAPHLVPGHTLFVYGDDIIVPKDDAANVIAALRFAGLVINDQKSFTSSEFRESCGGDYFNGVWVRPHHLKKDPAAPEDWLSLINGVGRIMMAFGPNHATRRKLRRVWFKLQDRLPANVRVCRGPAELGDLVIHDAKSETWSIRLRNCVRYVKVWRPARFKTVSFRRFCPDVQIAVALYGVRMSPERWPEKIYPVGHDPRGLPLRDGVYGYKVGWVPFS